MQLEWMIGDSMLDGSSERSFPKKYALTVYILLCASLKKTGRSSGKINIVPRIELNDIATAMKKRQPFLSWTPIILPFNVWNMTSMQIPHTTKPPYLRASTSGNLRMLLKERFVRSPS